MSEQKRKQRVSASFVTGAIALAFLIIGYQTALFVHRAATLKILSGATAPDTVFVFESPVNEVPVNQHGSIDKRRGGTRAERHRAARPEPVEKVIRTFTPRTYESFRFNPNTVSVSDLCRLGFTEKQAESIDSYRRKGGRFWRPSDFAKSYVVSDTLFRRLENTLTSPLSISMLRIRRLLTLFPASADILRPRWCRIGKSWAAILTSCSSWKSIILTKRSLRSFLTL